MSQVTSSRNDQMVCQFAQAHGWSDCSRSPGGPTTSPQFHDVGRSQRYWSGTLDVKRPTTDQAEPKGILASWSASHVAAGRHQLEGSLSVLHDRDSFNRCSLPTVCLGPEDNHDDPGAPEVCHDSSASTKILPSLTSYFARSSASASESTLIAACGWRALIARMALALSEMATSAHSCSGAAPPGLGITVTIFHPLAIFYYNMDWCFHEARAGWFSAKRPNLPQPQICRQSCRSKMSTINPVEHGARPNFGVMPDRDLEILPA
jgi:hypothetical protein